MERAIIEQQSQTHAYPPSPSFLFKLHSQQRQVFDACSAIDLDAAHALKAPQRLQQAMGSDHTMSCQIVQRAMCLCKETHAEG